MMTPEQLKKIIALLKEEDGEGALKLLEELAAGGPAEGEAPPDPTAAAAEPPDPEKEAMAALSRDVLELVGAKSAGEASTRVKAIVTAHAETEARARTLEASERRSLVASLVKIGAETPATAWQKNAEGEIGEGDARAPVKRLADEPIAELRSRVEALSKANPRARIAPPVVVSGTEKDLTPEDQARAKAIKDPEKRARYVELRLSKSSK